MTDSEVYTINALAELTGSDRRTLTKRLKDIAVTEVDGKSVLLHVGHAKRRLRFCLCTKQGRDQEGCKQRDDRNDNQQLS